MIDSNLLIHSCKVYTPEGMNADRKPVYDEGIQLSRVRISHTDSVIMGSNGLQTADTMNLYYDCHNSYPLGFVPVAKQKLVFNDKEYTIDSVKPSYAMSDTPEFYKAVLK